MPAAGRGEPANPADPRHLAVRSFVSGVCVLTAWQGDAAHGTTVSSVTSVSKEPLLIGACLRVGSALTELARTGGRFAVNVLAREQPSLAGWFADAARPPGLAQFHHLDWEPDPFSGAPWIGGSLASLGCRLTDVVRAGDHDLLLAEVVTVRSRPGVPLLHFTGRLHEGMLRRLPREETHPATGRTITPVPA
jgi:flavin reductase (DIM6/NTAB) family NADH-FMN oxidoreductase RutF